MSVQIKEFGNITQYGDRHRIEKTDLVLTGKEDYNVYELQGVDNARHPVHNSETTEDMVWVLKGTHQNDKDAHTQVRKLLNMPY
jgi:hypothetical protein